MLGKNIKYYRRMNKMSQESLAQQVGIEKMSISHYEKDKRTPDIATIRKLASALNVSMDKLTVTYSDIPSIQHGAFRKRSSIAKNRQELILEYIDRYLSRLFMVVSFLGEAVLAPPPQIEKVPASTSEISGRYLRQVLDLPASGPIGNITDILENKGYIICPVAINEDHFSGNSGYVNGRPYIAVNSTMSAEHQRFTLIHELVHLIFSFNEEASEEKLVNGITGAFLLPADDIKRELGPKRRDIRSDLRYIQHEYNVSMAAIIVRALQTDIITQKTFDITQKWLSARGLRRNEHSGIQPERSHLLEQLTIRAVAEDEITVSKAAELLDRPFIEVRNLCYGGV